MGEPPCRWQGHQLHANPPSLRRCSSLRRSSIMQRIWCAHMPRTRPLTPGGTGPRGRMFCSSVTKLSVAAGGSVDTNGVRCKQLVWPQGQTGVHCAMFETAARCWEVHNAAKFHTRLCQKQFSQRNIPTCPTGTTILNWAAGS